MDTKLSTLLVSETEIASEILHSALQDYIQIGKETGKVIPQPAYFALERKSKILIYLLALRAAAALGIATKTEASVNEIAEAVGFDAKTAGEYLSRLKKQYLAKKGSGYSIPPEKIRMASAFIQEMRKSKKA